MSLMLDDEVALENDSRYKTSVIAIEKVLKQFERSTGWADLIPILDKVKQTLIETCAQCSFIPKRLTLTKRLAQCLHPALPSGVHLKTLEVYETIFRMIDKVHLQRDIVLYSYGLFPLLPVAALNVKPVLLKLYETYFLPLDEALDSILTGFLIGLFSTLEEGGDFYDRVIRLLDNLANRIDEMYFYTCIWSAVHLVATVRYSAIAFIINHFDKRKTLEDQIYLTGLSTDTMVSAVCTCLYDSEHPLVQRFILDFLLICLPLHKHFLSKMNLIKIITMTFHILLKRDMGLSRRIYAWFLGTNELCDDQYQSNDPVTSSSYFHTHTRDILIESIKYLLNTTSLSTDALHDQNNARTLPLMWPLTKLIRVLLVLVEKDDVGPDIIEFIFMPYCLMVYKQAYFPSKVILPITKQQENDYVEILKTFQILLDTLESYFIWEQLTKSFNTIFNQQIDEKCLTNKSTIEQICGVINMLLDIFSIESFSDIQFEYLSEMFDHLMITIDNNIECLTSNQIVLCFEILLKILKTIISTTNSKEILESDFEDENDQLIYVDNVYSTDIYNKLVRTDSIGNLQSPDIRAEQEDLNDIEQLLRQMVRKIEKQIYKLNNPSAEEKRTQSITKAKMESMIHIENSIRLYKNMFHRFIVTYLIDKNQLSITDRFQSIFTIIQTKTNDYLSKLFNSYEKSNEFKLKLNTNANEYQTAFDISCKLLTELSCFSKQSFSISSDKTQFDDWFIDLCLLSLCRTEQLFFQTKTTSVLIEVFNYSLNNDNHHSIDHFYSQEQITFLLNETNFFQYIIADLWEYLSEKYSREYHFQASYNLSLLHSMLPNNLCEDFILINIDQSSNEWNVVEKYRRFFKLWNLSRSGFHRTNEQCRKSFQSCLVFILSRLNESNDSCLKSMIQQWIYDCFVHGDMCRIFDILLMKLLHSDTMRHEIQRIDPISNSVDEINEIQFCLLFDSDDHDENEYDETDEEKRIRTISCINPGESLYQVRSSPQTNRFPSFSSLSPSIFSNIRSLSPPILSKAMKSRTPTMSPIQSQNNLINSSSQAHSVPTYNIIHEEILLPTYSPTDYILLYNGTYDWKRILISLNIIENLIDFIPEQLVHCLLTTSSIQSASMNIDNNQMHEFYRKHFCLIEGKDFDLSTEEHQSYLYILFNILLILTYSYQENIENIQENHQIHIHCLSILTRLCHNLSSICMENGILMNYVVSLLKKVAFQKIILCLFNRIINPTSDFLQLTLICNFNKEVLHEQSMKQYLKQLIQLLEEIILLENLISLTDLNLIQQFIVQQDIFLSTILNYLKQIHFIENHRYIISLVVRILPHCGSALKTISTRIIVQICRNLCFIAQYHNQQDIQVKFKDLSTFDTLDYIIYLIERLSYICNYCLGTTTNNFQHFTPILCPQHWTKRLSINTIDVSDARRSMLKKFPLILSSLLFIWKTIGIDQTNSIWINSNIKQIRETILELISLLIKSHGVSFMRAVAQYWGESKLMKDNIDEKQMLIYILININNPTINDLIYYINELIIQNQSVKNDKKKQNYIVWCLQFLLTYFEQQKNLSIEYWSMLAAMFKECLAQSMSSSIIFLIIKILSYFVKQSPVFVEKRDLKDFQEITMKVLEQCNTIVASSLKQTTWLRKNLQVRRDQADSETVNDSSSETDNESPILDVDDTSQSKNSSLNTLTILAEHAAKLLDVVYNLTDDRDRVVLPYLQNLIPNLMPYVRTHVASYRTASILLMNISHYSYTRKTWKKDVFEQLFDSGFFQVDISILRTWKVIIDNLVTNGKSTFRDVFNRISTIQTGLFVSKEQEYEQRAMLIKRFAFVIYASEKDQYNQYLPEILTCITDLLKLPQIPVLHIQLFLLLRVLLIRISSKNLVSFWPIIMAELIHILLKIEEDLTVTIEEDTKLPIQRTDLISNPSLTLYLYGSKLLDVLIAIPSSELYHFQLFRSAFVVDQNIHNQLSLPDTFTSFSIRISKLFDEKFQSLSIIPTLTCPYLRLRTITNINELSSFFHYLSNIHLYDISYLKTNQLVLSDKTNDIEISVFEDFLES
ncbi:hypothetical protein I4U23_014493 [Adineta vaga]|nr:hypothetical protein I4U23_014493 [Adineta vaga]